MRRLTKCTKFSFSSIIEYPKLNIYEKGSDNVPSGVNATLFGVTSNLGSKIGCILNHIGSTMIYPLRELIQNTYANPATARVRSLFGRSASLMIPNMDDEDDIRFALKDMNTAICCIGNNKNEVKHQEFEKANIIIPRTIARAASKTPSMKRLIYISSVGVDPDSPSQTLKTKWYGEQEVREAFPNSTIIRPSLFYLTEDDYSSFVARWRLMMRIMNGASVVVGEGNSKLQPILVDDVAQAVANALFIPESEGKTYELGGPNIFTFREAYELLFNVCNIIPYSISIPLDEAFEMVSTPMLMSKWKNLFRLFSSYEEMCLESIDRVCSPNSLKIEDLAVKPVSFSHMVKSCVQDIYGLYNTSVFPEKEYYINS